ncbi:uncharacterized protein MONOS_10833 [Monocercomonoides exilis]|uniref:uncharacterized protein n=1 Tax=Monocercomonoides exilis TaxID=2049356 RepID=UPI003559BB5C|nr:hypothetical protein MONOS_10833 [Monocercomonoides exilis]|eukprot:MONOS_10833.1-p1 / transcript=MONOS_10833.1 / gene=MONOS_10833 / organism=Monocercomonoides_exilis_PA203 / gene_product=unspecified product / transcript_product=unspecified product / location=Mono_scaffold00509:10819-11481(-) / protein_length=200 / sequence_SO=supercontig / SO=protein_coding / is_pseudo=false
MQTEHTILIIRMKVGSDDETEDGIQESPIAHNILKLFSELEHCDDDEQKVKIEKLNEIVDDMNEEEFRYVFMTGLFNKIDKMINEKKISLQNAIVLLKRMGHFRSLKFPWVYIFKGYSLSESFGKTIIEENKKKKGKNEKLLIDLCECYLLLNFSFPSKLTSIFVSNLLRIALNKEENEEIQEEVEVALLALTCMCQEV